MGDLLGPRPGIDIVVPHQPMDSQHSQDSQGIPSRTESPISEPEPLRRPLPPAEPYPLQALGNILGAAARRICDVLCVPEAMAGQSILAAASLAVQAHADIEIDGRREQLSLWLMTVGESGERKSACDQQALRMHREHERTALEAYAHQKVDYDIEMKAYDAATKSATKGEDQDAIHHALVQLGAAPQVPLLPLLMVGNPTVEAIHIQLVAGLPNIGLFHDDAGEFLGGYSMGKDHRLKTAAGLSRLWDAGEFDRIRKGDGGSKYYGKRLALHLMMQPVIAEMVLSDIILTGQGFLARCLLSWPNSTIGHRPYVETNLNNDAAMLRFWERMSALLSIPPTMRHDRRNELEPRSLSLSADAKRRWIDVHDAIEKDMGDCGEWVSVRPWASKAAAQVLRIAGVLTLTEQPNSGVIDIDQIDRAAILVNHHLTEAVRIVGTHSVPKSIRDAERLLDWCHQNKIALLCSADAMRLGPNSIRSKGDFDKAMEELESSEWVEQVGGGATIDGKHRKRVWAVRLPS
jgi:Protein of unknown function (DUF3987)